MAGSSRVQIARDGRVVRVTLDRPPLNVLDIPTIQELDAGVRSLVSDSAGPDVLVIQGAGERGFSAGVDIRDHTPDRVEQMLRSFHGVFRALAAADRISIAAVHGVCLGGGFELAVSCDLMVCEETARLGLPEIEVGCFPPVAVAAFPERVGPARALDWVTTGRAIPVAEAAAAGLVARVAPAGGLAAAVDTLVASLLAKSSSVLRVTARALKEPRRARFEAALAAAERAYLSDLLATRDLQEGVAAFVEKRSPVWTHR